MLENLRGILENETEGTLYHSVATDLMDCYDNSDEDFICHIKEVLNYGCSSGVVSSQIYYKDTHKFFDTHRDEIFDLYNDCINEYGNISLEVNANNLSWLAYEETTRKIANDLNLEY